MLGAGGRRCRRCARTSDDDKDLDDERWWRHRPPFVVRWCWSDRVMEVAFPTVDGEATATPMAQGQVHAATTLKSTPAASATGYLPRLRRSRNIQRASELRRGNLTYPARHIPSWLLSRRHNCAPRAEQAKDKEHKHRARSNSNSQRTVDIRLGVA
mgnify:CR=1 FL=1